MRHTVIIPHRNRGEDLAACLASINSSARRSDMDDYEVVVVDTQSEHEPESTVSVRVVSDNEPLDTVLIGHEEIPAYSKTRALNIGIEASTGHFLTFLDADSIVGQDFMGPWREPLLGLENESPELGVAFYTKVCYRVRLLPRERFDPMAPYNAQDHFKDYEHFPITAEFYGSAAGGKNWPEDPEPMRVFGSSQFTITRETLGDLRFNEEYLGAGYEDIEMNRRIARHYKTDYRALLVTEPARSILQVQTIERAEDWHIPRYATHNQRMYEST